MRHFFSGVRNVQMTIGAGLRAKASTAVFSLRHELMTAKAKGLLWRFQTQPKTLVIKCGFGKPYGPTSKVQHAATLSTRVPACGSLFHAVRHCHRGRAAWLPGARKQGHEPWTDIQSTKYYTGLSAFVSESCKARVRECHRIGPIRNPSLGGNEQGSFVDSQNRYPKASATSKAERRQIWVHVHTIFEAIPR